MNSWGFCALFAIIMAFNAASHDLGLIAYLLLGVGIVCVFRSIDTGD